MSWLQTLQHLVSEESRVLAYGSTAIPETMSGAAHFKNWIEEGKHADMRWMEKYAELRIHPKRLWPQMQTVVMVLWQMPGTLDPAMNPDEIRVAAYAQGEDYHRTLGTWLRSAVQELSIQHPGLEASAFVDSHPVLEREFAVRCGLGWIGKNSLLINQKFGSAFLLGGFACNQVGLMEPAPLAGDFCGACTRCVDACPTQAIGPCKDIDSRRCISYLTIEKRGPFEENTPDTDSWIFGCDLCQIACPWNKKHLGTSAKTYWPTTQESWEFFLTPGNGFKSKTQGTPLERTGRKGLQRNLDHIRKTK